MSRYHQLTAGRILLEEVLLPANPCIQIKMTAQFSSPLLNIVIISLISYLSIIWQLLFKMLGSI